MYKSTVTLFLCIYSASCLPRDNACLLYAGDSQQVIVKIRLKF